jgi:hypothetical protein
MNIVATRLLLQICADGVFSSPGFARRYKRLSM